MNDPKELADGLLDVYAFAEGGCSEEILRSLIRAREFLLSLEHRGAVGLDDMKIYAHLYDRDDGNEIPFDTGKQVYVAP